MHTNRYQLEHRVKVIQEAIEDGHFVEMGNDYTLLLDYDEISEEQARKKLNERLCLFGDVFKLRIDGQWLSRSGHGVHFKIKLWEPMVLKDRITYQALLGSDWKREMLGLWEADDNLEPFLIRPGLKHTVKQIREINL